MEKNLNENSSKDSMRTESGSTATTHTLKKCLLPECPRWQAVDKGLSIKIPQGDSDPARLARAQSLD